MGPHRAKRVLLGVLAAGLLGWAVFGAMVWRASEVRRAASPEARAAVAEVRALFPDQQPWLVRDHDGRFVRGTPAGAAPPVGPRPRQLRVLAWHAGEQRLVRTDVPMWFFKLKEPVARITLRRAGVDLDALGLRSRDLDRLGPGLVLDEEFADGDLLVIWTR